MHKLLVIIVYLVSFNAYAVDYVFSFDNGQDELRFQQLTKELRCVVCPNQNLQNLMLHWRKICAEKFIYRLVMVKAMKKLNNF